MMQGDVDCTTRDLKIFEKDLKKNEKNKILPRSRLKNE